jgi:hypothetical protein
MHDPSLGKHRLGAHTFESVTLWSLLRPRRLAPWFIIGLTATLWFLLRQPTEDLSATFPLRDPVQNQPANTYRHDITSTWFPYTEEHQADGWPHWEAENNKALNELMKCMIEGSCKANQVRPNFHPTSLMWLKAISGQRLIHSRADSRPCDAYAFNSSCRSRLISFQRSTGRLGRRRGCMVRTDLCFASERLLIVYLGRSQ